MPETPYNGWTNRETWVVNLWLTNEERLYHEYQRLQGIDDLRGFVRGLVHGTVSVQGAEQAIRDFLHDLYPSRYGLSFALRLVNWNELWAAHEEAVRAG